ncbi:MAG: hypothetical protein JSS95_16555 [Acidobacteria bacterium]|nr:hypothetical protein [Acidobacteriota bacterium]
MKAGLLRQLLVTTTIAYGVCARGQDLPQRGDVAFGGGQMIRGTVTAAASDHLTIKTDTGETYTVALSANTRLMKDQRIAAAAGGERQPRTPGTRQQIKAEDIKPGDGVGAMGELDAPKKTVHALFVAVMDADEVKKLREGMGKVFITGKVMAIDDVKLTILRSDNVTQVIEVDETTSFRKGGGRRAFASADGAAEGPPPGAATGGTGGGESITLADIKAGDMVAGQGSVKHGVFVPTNLTVVPQGAFGARMRRGGEASGPTPQTAPKQ